MINTVVRLYKFTPTVIDELYLDDADYHGLLYWYNDAEDYIKQINKGLGALG